LIENGLEHGGGRVLVRAERLGDTVHVTVSDGGPGLSRPIGDVEEAHWRVHRGHGLAIARDALAAIGARLETVDASEGPAVSIELDAFQAKGVRPRRAARARREAVTAPTPRRAAGQV
jgi:signal transduction histidine kinase